MKTDGTTNALAAKASAANALREEARLAAAARRGDAEEAGEHFEAMFASILAREMRGGLSEGFFGSGPGADTFSAWMDEHVGRVMAERGALGIREMIVRNTAYETADGPDGSIGGEA